MFFTNHESNLGINARDTCVIKMVYYMNFHVHKNVLFLVSPCSLIDLIMEKYIEKCERKFTYVPPSFDDSYALAEKIVTEEVVETKNQYICPKCKSKNIKVETRQIRSADEGSSTFITCGDCGFTKRKN